MFEKILEGLSCKFDGELAQLGKGYTGVPLDKANYHSIEPSDASITAVDAGYAELVAAADFSIGFIRTAAVGISPKVFEWIFITHACMDQGKLAFSTVFEPASKTAFPLKQFSVGAYDSEFSEGKRMVKFSRLAEAAWRQAELATSVMAASSLSRGDILLRDGTLEQEDNEQTLFGELISACSSRGVLLAGLAKTSTMLTHSGYSVSSLLQKNSPEGAWYYSPLFSSMPEAHKAEICFAKLHSKSKHCFRLESASDTPGVVSALAANSADISFPGYPYCLQKADRFARVTHSDAAYLKPIILSRLKKVDESAVDAHGILDRLAKF